MRFRYRSRVFLLGLGIASSTGLIRFDALAQGDPEAGAPPEAPAEDAAEEKGTNEAAETSEAESESPAEASISSDQPAEQDAEQTAEKPMEKSAAAAAPAIEKRPVLTAMELKDEAEERALLESMVQRYEESAKQYREATRKNLSFRYEKQRQEIYQTYEDIIVNLEVVQKDRRIEAIAVFENFIERYPDNGAYTPDAMFRLAELYFERAYEEYFLARKAFNEAYDSWDPDSGEAEPVEPAVYYVDTISTMQTLIVNFPDYRLVDGAYYLLGYCLGEQGEDDRAVVAFEELVKVNPASQFAAEVWTRIGEYYFDTNQLQKALAAYNEVLGDDESVFYDKALYKLAWTHYRMANPETSPERYQNAVNVFVRLLEFNERTKAAGRERGGELRSEAIQYIAISYSEEKWGSYEKMMAYLRTLEDRNYKREIMVSLADVYFDQTKYPQAIRVYKDIMKLYPLHEKAPLTQDKIVVAHEKFRDLEGAARERDILAAQFAEDGEWYKTHESNGKAIARAMKVMNKALYGAAIYYHQQAQAYKNSGKVELAQEAYTTAADAYQDYLRRFPHDDQIYELSFYLAETLYYSLQFEESAKQYIWIRDSKAGDKFREDAAYSAVLSYENAVKLAEIEGKVPKVTVVKSEERESKEVVPREIPYVRQRLIDASDEFAQLSPDHENLAAVLYNAAEVYYVHDQYDEARKRFEQIITTYPDKDVARYASTLTIETFLTEEDYASVQAFASRILEATKDVEGAEEFFGEIMRFKSGAVFKIAEDLADKGKSLEAAEMYIELLKENPDTKYGDLVLNNAAVEYEKLTRYESASKLYERLYKEYPDSELADAALFRVGLNAERFFDFEKAVNIYTKLVKDYPDSKNRPDAIFNAALSYYNTQDYEKAASTYDLYCREYSQRDDAPKVCFKTGQVYEKMGEPRRVIRAYEQFVRKYAKNKKHKDRIAEAHLKMARSYEKMNQERDALKSYRDTIAVLGKGDDKKSAAYAAEAKFELVLREFDDFTTLKFSGSSKQQQKQLKGKAERLKEVEKSYKEVLRFKQIGWTLASLYQIGRLYQDFADSLIKAECPADVKKAARQMGAEEWEVCDEYRILLEEKSVAIEDKAVEAFELVINRSREFQVANEWTDKTMVALNALRKAMYPLQQVAKFHLDDNSTGRASPDVAIAEVAKKLREANAVADTGNVTPPDTVPPEDTENQPEGSAPEGTTTDGGEGGDTNAGAEDASPEGTQTPTNEGEAVPSPDTSSDVPGQAAPEPPGEQSGDAPAGDSTPEEAGEKDAGQNEEAPAEEGAGP